jgi:hypothetical protein
MIAAMGSNLRVQFDDPQHGWMIMTIRSDAGIVTLTVSSVAYTSQMPTGLDVTTPLAAFQEACGTPRLPQS